MSGESVTEISACFEICKETLRKSDISETAGMFDFFLKPYKPIQNKFWCPWTVMQCFFFSCMHCLILKQNNIPEQMLCFALVNILFCKIANVMVTRGTLLMTVAQGLCD